MENIDFTERHVGLKVRCMVRGKLGTIENTEGAGQFPVSVLFEDESTAGYRRDGSIFLEGKRVLLIGDSSTVSIIEEKVPEQALLCPFCNVVHEPARIKSGKWFYTSMSDCPLNAVFCVNPKDLKKTMVRVIKGVNELIESATNAG